MAPLLHRAAIKTRMQVALHGTARCLQTDLVRISVRFFRRERSSLHRSEIKPSLPCDSSMFENVHDSLQLITEWAGLSVNLRPVFVSSPMNARASIAMGQGETSPCLDRGTPSRLSPIMISSLWKTCMVLSCLFLSLSLFVVHDLVKLSLSLFFFFVFFSCCATVYGEERWIYIIWAVKSRQIVFMPLVAIA